jgi:hypothetical protein
MDRRLVKNVPRIHQYVLHFHVVVFSGPFFHHSHKSPTEDVEVVHDQFVCAQKYDWAFSPPSHRELLVIWFRKCLTVTFLDTYHG